MENLKTKWHFLWMTLLLPLTLHATSPLLESLYAPLIKQNLCSSTEECKKKRYIQENRWLGVEKISIYEGSEITQETLKEILKAALLYYKESPSERRVKVVAYRGSYQETSWWDKAYMEVEAKNDHKNLDALRSYLPIFLLLLFSSSLFFFLIPLLGKDVNNEWRSSPHPLPKRSMILLSRALLQGLVFSLLLIACLLFLAFFDKFSLLLLILMLIIPFLLMVDRYRLLIFPLLFVGFVINQSLFLLSFLILFLAFSLARGLYHFLIAKRDGSKWNPIKPEGRLFTLLLLYIPVVLTFVWWPLGAKLSQEFPLSFSPDHVGQPYGKPSVRVEDLLAQHEGPLCQKKGSPKEDEACYRRLFFHENRDTGSATLYYYMLYRPDSIEIATEAMGVYSDHYRESEVKPRVEMRFYFQRDDERFRLTLKLKGDKR